MINLFKKKEFKFDIDQHVNFNYDGYFVFGTIIDKKQSIFGNNYYLIKYGARYDRFSEYKSFVMWVKEKNMFVSNT